MIQVLSPETAEKIAAGEVIERPASVVKELVENALDAGAKDVSIRLENGGRDLIEVQDNGRGMGHRDLELCTLRHATSKISSLQDLDDLRSLGFRGEALPSIQAASELAITSRSSGEESAYEWKDGKVQTVTYGHFLGSDHGTEIRVQSLFSTIPARLKFLKSPRAEAAAIRDWLEKIAVSRPEIGFDLLHNEKSLFSVRAAASVDTRVAEILGERGDPQLLKSTTQEDEIEVSLIWLQGVSLPHSRKMVQIVNGRVLRDRLLTQAMMSSFRQTLLPGQFPALYLRIEMPPSEMDVNVHPSKMEVRFRNAASIYQRVQSQVSKLIQTRGAPRWVPGPSRPRSTEKTWAAAEKTGELQLSAPPPENIKVPATKSDSVEPAPSKVVEKAAVQGQFRGTVFSTYLLFEDGTDLVLVDQHAAHERIRYETLREGFLAESVHTQSLLLPEAVSIKEDDSRELESRLPVLQRLGFETELFGQSSIVFRSIPSVWGNTDLKVRISNLLDRLLSLDLPEDISLVDETVFEKMASEACRSSVMAGDKLSEAEVNSLIQKLNRCQHPWNCPHGRPTVVRIPESRFEKWFQRTV